MRSDVGGQRGAYQDVSETENPQYHPPCPWLISIRVTSGVSNHLSKENVVKENSSYVGEEKLEKVHA